MPTATAQAASSPDLADLLAHARELGEDLVAEARRRPPREVLAAVEALIDECIEFPDFGHAAVRAIHLAAELRLPGAVPLLRRCLDGVAPGAFLRDAALAALARLGPAAIQDIVAACDAGEDAGDRSELAEVLAAIPCDDPGIRAALLRHAGEAPGQAAQLLARRGDWRAVPGLILALEAHLAEPQSECSLCTAAGLEALAMAVAALGGTLTADHVVGIDAVVDRAEVEATTWDEEEEPSAQRPVVRKRGPGRNDPCWCGSGKKYKKCHLDEDRRGVGH